MSYQGLKPKFLRVGTDEIALSETTSAITGTQNDVSVFSGYTMVLFSGSPSITGIAQPSAAQLKAGKLIVITNAHATNDLTIQNDNVSSSDGNKIITGTGSDLSLAAGASVLLGWLQWRSVPAAPYGLAGHP